MANALYTAYANLALNTGAPDLDTDNIKCVLTDHGADTPLPATDDFLNDISAGTVATSGNMTGASITGGAIDYADFAFSTVTGSQSESLTWYKDTGSAATSNLIVFFDTATGLPITPNGADINVALNASGLFSLI